MPYDFLTVTAAVEIPGPPWRVAYQHASALITHDAAIDARNLGALAAHVLAELERIAPAPFDLHAVHWFAGWPLLSPESFAHARA